MAAAGELRVKGDGVFRAYHGRPRSTSEAKENPWPQSRKEHFCFQAFDEDTGSYRNGGSVWRAPRQDGFFCKTGHRALNIEATLYP